jgi:hypothetical protein
MMGVMSRRRPRPTPQPVPPTPSPTPSPLDFLAQNFMSSSQRRADDIVKYGGPYSGLGSRTADLAVGAGVKDSPLLRAGALAGDIVLDPANLIGVPGGVAAARATVPVARTAMGTTARTLRTNPNMSPGVRNVFDLIAGRHASPNPNLANELQHPRDVSMMAGRDWGPGFYYESTRPLDSMVPYTDTLARYGDNFYMPKMSFTDMLKIGRSKGMADPWQDLERMPITGGSKSLLSTEFDSPVIQDALKQGFTGVRGQTNWLVGNPDRVGGLPNLGVRPVTPADDATYPALEAMLRKIFGG